ncbi:BON domain-containing protein [Methyloprofundus sp.]|uniref:BON domain-containing protein n=1 Tax=Methyloprofundus sp. TaxID=2020875 RepID=UPI003D0E5752
MKQVLLLICVLMLTACSSVGQSLAELTGLSFLHDRRDSAAITLDERIEDTAILELYGLDQIKDKSHFNITSYNGKVLVTGEAKTEDIREIIIANVRIISGVKLVHNEMIVGPISSLQSRSEDSLLTIKVKDALAEIKDKPGFDATRVKVITENNVVFLMGLVHEEEGLAAAKAVQQVAGVRKIVTVFEYIDFSNEN